MKDVMYLDVYIDSRAFEDSSELENYKIEEAYRRLGSAFASKYATKEYSYIYFKNAEEFIFSEPLSTVEMEMSNLFFRGKRIRLRLEYV